MTRAVGVTGAAIRQQLGRRPEGDFYRTPSRCTDALLRAEAQRLRGAVWEPACGDGAIVRVLRSAGHEVVCTDLHDRGLDGAMTGRDFLAETALLAPAIITNPPFDIADDFARHALRLQPRFLALFHRLAWLEGARRHADLWDRMPPSRVWVFSSRQTLWRGDDPDAKATGGAVAFAWYVWDANAPPGTRLGWLQTQ